MIVNIKTALIKAKKKNGKFEMKLTDDELMELACYLNSIDVLFKRLQVVNYGNEMIYANDKDLKLSTQEIITIKGALNLWKSE